MRNPKKVKAKLKAKAKPKAKKEEMELDEEPSTSTAKVWRPGIDPVDEDEELAYDPTAYDCLHRFEVDWPCLSFDALKDDLGGPRSTFPHTVYLVCGTQAATARQNYVAFLKLAQLGQGRHGKKAAAEEDDDSDASSADDDSDSDDGSSDGEEREGDEDQQMGEEKGDKQSKGKGKARMRGAAGEPPATFHYRRVAMPCGVNRVRAMPQQPALVAVWGDNAQVRLIDGSKLVSELASETEPTAATAKGRSKPMELKPLATHSHSTEGFALDWSPVRPGRLASGDNRHRIHVWEPAEGGRWAVGGAHQGHSGAVEDLQWSPSEDTVFASCGTDRTIRIWDSRERGRPMLTAAEAHTSDVNVISWNRSVAYMLASGADDGGVRIWDLRTFASSSAPAEGSNGAPASGPTHVAQFTYHRSHVTSVEWCPYEGSMLASCSADNQLAVWDLALERDPEEEAALAPEGNAAAPEDLPAQLLFLHAGQTDLKELHWHPQIPGVIVSTAGDGFNLFKASNM
ncbi:hypothetical protein Vretimale_817 [Volvox reticuliferus]|uniref:Glutamate-rich WD repeat-containing protein 1 n=1 Tax=Volvox reticuliferus TaxID=1737510 RepID=A0A8J4C536_9CHLO|nr:hypothetical protein Vretifemale_2256 [Volvox reticuliferus]GIL94586.1 hypothetical protein Vretimale_817 [Volvox reticuliferus]